MFGVTVTVDAESGHVVMRSGWQVLLTMTAHEARDVAKEVHDAAMIAAEVDDW